MAKKKQQKLSVTQVRSQIGALERHKVTLRTLGLGRIGRTVVHGDTPQIRGMIYHVRHLVRVETAK
ncbi:MAG: 50S ribosomal protein L30 [Candidatus Coatesbacteria bacterium RBG_13_66_14]|uniref:50S ribosomal protein L30 n=1 Tax=Candidatus Coatesbacteria bacterium RBG_13_66_14 TaxID=1817816 RepID=A0A1F5F218_9BACT|nr:MAG: 50S ribosomal protein L30 [Candidatus Coatesbacteria bacterium RBG_13_66_14]